MKHLLKKYFDGTISHEELEFFLNNLDKLNTTDARRVYDYYKKNTHDLKLDPLQKLRIKSRVNLGIEEQENEKFKNWKYWKVAATIAVLISVSIYLFILNLQPTVLKTGFGENLTITLPDNSVVNLNSNSTLKFSKSRFNKKNREVWLEGEAFFDVAKDSSKSFLVNADEVIVKVIGTEFNVNTRRSQTKVYLEEGKVSINDKELNLLEELLPGDQLTILENDQILKERPNDENNPSSWKEGTKQFYNIKMQEILLEFRDIYGIEYTFQNRKLLEKEYSIALPLTDLELAKSIIENLTENELITVN